MSEEEIIARRAYRNSVISDSSDESASSSSGSTGQKKLKKKRQPIKLIFRDLLRKSTEGLVAVEEQNEKTII